MIRKVQTGGRVPALLLLLTCCCVAAAALAAPAYAANGGPGVAAAGSMTLPQVVGAMAARNRAQTETLEGYSSRRVYTVSYTGFPPIHAEMVVSMTYTAPDRKTFTLISESGSKWLVHRILHRLTRTESDAQRNAEQTTLNNENYTFSRLAYQKSPDGCSYSLWVEPKHRSDVLYRGQVWLNEQDFGVCRMEIEPAKNPSLWIRSTAIHQENAKVGNFWLPSDNKTVSHIRLGGVATLTIHYSDYKVLKTRR